MRNNLKIASHKLIIFTWKAIEAGVMNNLSVNTEICHRFKFQFISILGTN